MNAEEILQNYVESNQIGKDNQLRAVIGKVLADRTQELAHAIQLLHQQLPVTISELRTTISQNTDKIIEANERLSKSNEVYTKWMKRLTFALVFVGIAQVIVMLFK